jgi:uncharacterized protein (DUF427 family)
MSLTMGSGPFGHEPAGRFNVELAPGEIAYVEPSPRRVRAVRNGETVLDSTRAKMLHRHAQLARYFFPREDWRWDLLDGLEPVPAPPGAPDLADHVTFAWGDMDAWFEEDDRIVGHAIDPYHRVDVRDSSRHVRVSLGGEVLAESTRTRVIFETGLPPRWYFPPEDVVAALEPGDLQSTCAYKGLAGYHSYPAGGEAGENVAWFYRQPLEDAARVIDYIAFFDERVDVDIDGERRPRPHTPWGAPGWWRLPKPEV